MYRISLIGLFLHIFTEGQKKAQYDTWETEKRQNAEKIKRLKDNIKNLYTELGKRTTVKELIFAAYYSFS